MKVKKRKWDLKREEVLSKKLSNILLFEQKKVELFQKIVSKREKKSLRAKDGFKLEVPDQRNFF